MKRVVLVCALTAALTTAACSTLPNLGKVWCKPTTQQQQFVIVDTSPGDEPREHSAAKLMFRDSTLRIASTSNSPRGISRIANELRKNYEFVGAKVHESDSRVSIALSYKNDRGFLLPDVWGVIHVSLAREHNALIVQNAESGRHFTLLSDSQICMGFDADDPPEMYGANLSFRVKGTSELEAASKIRCMGGGRHLEQKAADGTWLAYAGTHLVTTEQKTATFADFSEPPTDQCATSRAALVNYGARGNSQGGSIPFAVIPGSGESELREYLRTLFGALQVS